MRQAGIPHKVDITPCLRRIGRIETDDPLMPWPYTKTVVHRVFPSIENMPVVYSADRRISFGTLLSQPFEEIGDEIIVQVETGESEVLDQGPGGRDRPELLRPNDDAD